MRVSCLNACSCVEFISYYVNCVYTIFMSVPTKPFHCAISSNLALSASLFLCQSLNYILYQNFGQTRKTLQGWIERVVPSWHENAAFSFIMQFSVAKTL